ncbi:MAG: hypothetical protein LBS68_03185 [Puniceicoccales bacterium]|jgi:hypothetical protein|nr:hypothetical protein [Puniceicoccales bacterium]
MDGVEGASSVCVRAAEGEVKFLGCTWKCFTPKGFADHFHRCVAHFKEESDAGWQKFRDVIHAKMMAEYRASLAPMLNGLDGEKAPNAGKILQNLLSPEKKVQRAAAEENKNLLHSTPESNRAALFCFLHGDALQHLLYIYSALIRHCSVLVPLLSGMGVTPDLAAIQAIPRGFPIPSNVGILPNGNFKDLFFQVPNREGIDFFINFYESQRKHFENFPRKENFFTLMESYKIARDRFSAALLDGETWEYFLLLETLLHAIDGCATKEISREDGGIHPLTRQLIKQRHFDLEGVVPIGKQVRASDSVEIAVRGHGQPICLVFDGAGNGELWHCGEGSPVEHVKFCLGEENFYLDIIRLRAWTDRLRKGGKLKGVPTPETEGDGGERSRMKEWEEFFAAVLRESGALVLIANGCGGWHGLKAKVAGT